MHYALAHVHPPLISFFAPWQVIGATTSRTGKVADNLDADRCVVKGMPMSVRALSRAHQAGIAREVGAARGGEAGRWYTFHDPKLRKFEAQHTAHAYIHAWQWLRVQHPLSPLACRCITWLYILVMRTYTRCIVTCQLWEPTCSCVNIALTNLFLRASCSFNHCLAMFHICLAVFVCPQEWSIECDV